MKRVTDTPGWRERLSPAHVAGGTAYAAAALVGAVTGDAQGFQARHAVEGGEARHAHPAGVDDHADALDGQRGLGDGGGEHDLAAAGGRRLHGGVLLLARQGAVKRVQGYVGG